MDKNQVKYSFNSYVSFRTQAREELAEIEKIINLQEQNQKVNSAFEKHSRNLLNAQGLLNSHNINGEVNMSDFWDYNNVINKLKEIKDKYQKENNRNNDNEYNCGWCKQSKIGQYWYNKVTGEKGKLNPISQVKGFYSKFCSQPCLNSWNQNNLKESTNNSSEIICHQCNKFFQGQYWHKNNPRESLIHKFCSESCCDTYWTKKQCSGADCSNLLTSEEICYCSPCSAQQEEIWKNLEKNQQDINKDLDNFNQGLNDYVENQRDNDGKESNLIVSVEREREREQIQSQQSQLLSEIMQLESNPTNSDSQELDSKKQQLKDLETKSKELIKLLPIDTQITILQKEIKVLENKTNKSQIETASLANKKKELNELLSKKNSSNPTTNAKPSDKTGLYVGGGIFITLFYF